MRKPVKAFIAESTVLFSVYLGFSLVSKGFNPLDYHIFWRAVFSIIVLFFIYNWAERFENSRGK